MFRWFWLWFHKKYANPNVTQLSIPAGIISRFDWHYFLYDEDGNVLDGAPSVFAAIKKSRKTKLYISRVWD